MCANENWNSLGHSLTPAPFCNWTLWCFLQNSRGPPACICAQKLPSAARLGYPWLGRSACGYHRGLEVTEEMESGVGPKWRKPGKGGSPSG